jgi:hypothetical protein
MAANMTGTRITGGPGAEPQSELSDALRGGWRKAKLGDRLERVRLTTPGRRFFVLHLDPAEHTRPTGRRQGVETPTRAASP